MNVFTGEVLVHVKCGKPWARLCSDLKQGDLLEAHRFESLQGLTFTQHTPIVCRNCGPFLGKYLNPNDFKVRP